MIIIETIKITISLPILNLDDAYLAVYKVTVRLRTSAGAVKAFDSG
jgi:hypothetical protein